MRLRDIFICGVLFLFAGCSDKHNDRMVREAEKYAVEDAHAVGQSVSDTISTRNLLLRSRSIETRLRQNGYTAAADKYVEVFEKTLKTEYPGLAKEILRDVPGD